MISNLEVNCSLETLSMVEFFFGWSWKSLTNHSYCHSKKPYMRFFTSYGSSFNYFKVIGPFSSVEKLHPLSTQSQKVNRTNSIIFSCFNWTLSFFNYSQKRRFFFLPNIFEFNHDLIIRIRTRYLFRSIPLPLILRESKRFFSSLNLFI